MPLPLAQYDELFDLAGDQCNGTADAAAIARLEQMLRDDPAARAAYLRYCFLHADLSFSDEALLGDASELLHDAPAPPQPRYPAAALRQTVAYFSHPIRFSLLVAVVTTVSLMLTSAQIPLQPPAAPTPTAPAIHTVPTASRHVVARLHQLDGVRWGQGIEPLVSGGDLKPGQVFSIEQGSVVVAFRSGAEVTLHGPTVFQLTSRQAGYLQRGKLSVKAPPRAQGFTIRTPNIEVVDLGTQFDLTVDASGVASVAVLQGAVEVRSHVRLPRFYWNFDQLDQPGAEIIRHAAATVGPGATVVRGLIGGGALDFNNTPQAYVDAGASGFEVSEGMTLEVLMTPRWNGSYGDYDEIFRKEDADRRMILAFQNDHGASAIAPDVARGPALSFGIHLAGFGYSEMDMPLDGKEGRPALSNLVDGQPHHLVATYDARTGLKAIYLDGIRRFSIQFPGAPRLIAGGPAPAVWGNLAPRAGEPFEGVLDEAAFYDFALTPEEIAAHFANVQQQRNYFNHAATAPPRSWQSITRLDAGQRKTFAADTGLPVE